MQTLIFAFISLIGGLAFFMFGMKFMSQSLEKMTGGLLEKLLRKVTANPLISIGLGIAITVAMQSSSATTVLLVGLVNSGIMHIEQTVAIIFGSNIGTTLTSWILSLSSISSENIFLQLLKPVNFSPIVAFIGMLMIMLSKKDKDKTIGNILLGFSLLMYGMIMMSDSLSPISQLDGFNEMIVKFINPFLAVMIGLVITAIIQSSAASIGILQALSMSSIIPYRVAFPIIMGQNIGTCATSLISCIGTNKNAKRVAILHLSIKVFGTIICLALFMLVDSIFTIELFDMKVNPFTIALIHTLFNIFITLVLSPFANLLINLTRKIIPGEDAVIVKDENIVESIKDKAKSIADRYVLHLDDRLFNQPSMALSECNNASRKMAILAKETIEESILLLNDYNYERIEKILINEEVLDKFEDKLGTYLVKLSAKEFNDLDTRKISKILHTLNDFERLGDHCVNLYYTLKTMNENKLKFSKNAQDELEVLSNAVKEIVSITVESYINNDSTLAKKVEPLEQVIDKLTAEIKDNHIGRLKTGFCSVQMGFVLSDCLTDFMRISDHCSNIAVAIIKLASNDEKYDTHKYLNYIKTNDEDFLNQFVEYDKTYVLGK